MTKDVKRVARKEHQQWLVDQYNRNRAIEDQVKDYAEYNRVMLDLEIKSTQNGDSGNGTTDSKGVSNK